MRQLSGGKGGMSAGQSILNDTNQEYEVHHGYSTVANGYASRISIQPGEVARKDANGSPFDFARWSIGKEEEFPSDPNRKKVSQM